MKKLFLGILMVLLAFSLFGDGFSGETTASIGIDTVETVPVYSLSTGVAYGAGVFSIGLNAETETFTDVSLDLPVGISTDFFGITITPAVVVAEEIGFDIDSDITATLGPVGITFGIGYGLDEALSLSAGASISPAEFLAISVSWADADDVLNEVTGAVTLEATATY